jgi:hypothetical protein
MIRLPFQSKRDTFAKEISTSPRTRAGIALRKWLVLQWFAGTMSDSSSSLLALCQRMDSLLTTELQKATITLRTLEYVESVYRETHEQLVKHDSSTLHRPVESAQSEADELRKQCDALRIYYETDDAKVNLPQDQQLFIAGTIVQTAFMSNRVTTAFEVTLALKSCQVALFPLSVLRQVAQQSSIATGAV